MVSIRFLIQFSGNKISVLLSLFVISRTSHVRQVCCNWLNLVHKIISNLCLILN